MAVFLQNRRNRRQKAQRRNRYVVKSKSWRDGPRIVHADKLKLIRKLSPHGVGENSAEITPTQRDRINSNQN